jgi:hypothetical protein
MEMEIVKPVNNNMSISKQPIEYYSFVEPKCKLNTLAHLTKRTLNKLHNTPRFDGKRNCSNIADVLAYGIHIKNLDFTRRDVYNITKALAYHAQELKKQISTAGLDIDDLPKYDIWVTPLIDNLVAICNNIPEFDYR